MEETWLAEIERRMAELDSGSVQTISWEELRAQLYDSPNVSGRP